MIIVAVLAQKGGVGKTTIAINLAAAAHLEGLRTLLIDMDPQASAFDWSAERADGSPLAGIAAVQYLGKDRDDKKRDPRAPFEAIMRGYDVVIFDGPARLDAVTQTAAIVADAVVVPVLPGPFEFWAEPVTTASLDQADAVRAHYGLEPVRRVFVLNRANGQRLSREAEQAFGARGVECGAIIRQRVAFPTAASRGESVFTTSPAADDAAQDMARLWRALKGPRPNEPKGKSKTRTRKGSSTEARGRGEARGG